MDQLGYSDEEAVKKVGIVLSVGLEPTTYALQKHRSTQMS